MLNKEKYMDELMKYACRKPMESGFAVLKVGGLANCITTSCSRCIFYDTDCTDCEERRRKWLEQEYEPPVDWSKVPVDTPILVRNNESKDWTRGHFAKYIVEVDKVCTWGLGRTSWTAGMDAMFTRWDYAKLAESEE